ncbi:hypothetical protein ACFQVC_27575 [Streptomyces monticola]|uniref:Uncharacterized protein n=1 Tax=Streptomyces monticola TaxID=2666263 RepID=A0ABW2JP75_9ACTN
MLLPTAHEATELIEVIRIADPARHITSQDLSVEPVALWTDGDVRQVLALIAELPEGEQYRCSLPAWGIRAHSATGPLFEIAFCFRCHGARIWGPEMPAGQRAQTFDAECPAAQELLVRFRACVVA